MDPIVEPASSRLGGLDLRHVGVLSALPRELGPFGTGFESAQPSRSSSGVQLHFPTVPGTALQVTSAVSGVGKVAAALGAAALLASGVEALFIVGTCGGLLPAHGVGELIHLFEAVQWDLSTREGRQVTAHPGLSEGWKRATQGRSGWALTADRPAIGWTARWRRARAVRAGIGASPANSQPEVPVADMETAAMGLAAERAGIPWAALRVISDAQRPLRTRLLRQKRAESSFQANYGAQAARPAMSLWEWFSQTGTPGSQVAQMGSISHGG